MGKSKYQAKVAKKIIDEPMLGTSGPKYIDDDIKTVKKPSSNQGAAVFLIITLVIVGSISGVLIYNENHKNDGTTTTKDYTYPIPRNTNTGTSTYTHTQTYSGNVVQDGKSFKVEYKLWKDMDGDGNAETWVDQGVAEGQYASFDVDSLDSTKFIVGFYSNILGMSEGQEKTFNVPIGQGYPTGHELGDKVLKFQVRITNIH